MSSRLWKSAIILSCAATCSFRADAGRRDAISGRPVISRHAGEAGEMHSAYLQKLYGDIDRRREGGGWDEDAGLGRFRETLLEIRARPDEFDEGVFGNPLADSLDREVRELAANGGAKSLDALAGELQNPQGEVRRSAAWGLGAILGRLSREGTETPGTREAFRRLREAARDVEWTVRAAAARALSQGGAHGDAAPMLRDPHREVRAAARTAVMRALGEAGPDAMLGALRSPDPRVREVSAEALGESGDASAVPALLDALDDRDRAVGEAANEAIRSISRRAASR